MITLTELTKHISFDIIANYIHNCIHSLSDNDKKDYEEIYKELGKAIPYYNESPYTITVTPTDTILFHKTGKSVPFSNATIVEWGKAIIDEESFATTAPIAILAKCIVYIHTSKVITDAEKLAKEYAQKATYAKLHYDRDCNDLANIFCIKHDFYTLESPDTYWVADKPGEILVTGDYTFNMSDIITDLVECIEEDALLKWYDYSLTCINDEDTPMYNYLNWYKNVYKQDSKIYS